MWIMKGTVVGAVLLLAFTVTDLKSPIGPLSDLYKPPTFTISPPQPYIHALCTGQPSRWFLDRRYFAPVIHVELHSMTHYRIAGCPTLRILEAGIWKCRVTQTQNSRSSVDISFTSIHLTSERYFPRLFQSSRPIFFEITNSAASWPAGFSCRTSAPASPSEAPPLQKSSSRLNPRRDTSCTAFSASPPTARLGSLQFGEAKL